MFSVHDEAADAWVARHFKGGRRPTNRIQEKKTKRNQKRIKERAFVPFMRCSIKAREKPQGYLKDNKARIKIHFLPIGQKKKESIILNSILRKDKQEKKRLYRRRGKRP